MRRAVTVLGVLACASVLASCQKPVPDVTVQSGAFSTTITPSTYAFNATHIRSTRPDLPEVSTRPGATVLVDVPQAVVHRGWALTAISLDSAHTVVGRSGPITDSHSYRVAAESNNGNPFIVQVVQLRAGKPDGSVWSFLVKVTNAT
jgi:hypothetical protein